jgi:hypothetical protein
MYLATAFSACWRDCQATGQIRSDLMVLKMERVNATGPSEPATFHHRVVVAVPAPAHRDQDAAFSEQRLIVDRAVLRSAVGMMDQPRRRVASHDSTKAAAFSECRAPASGPHSHAATASTRRADRRVPHSARGHHALGSATASASTGQCQDPPRSPAASVNWSVPAAPIHAETPASVFSRFP